MLSSEWSTSAVMIRLACDWELAGTEIDDFFDMVLWNGGEL